jgi:hypothetical protein
VLKELACPGERLRCKSELPQQVWQRLTHGLIVVDDGYKRPRNHYKGPRRGEHNARVAARGRYLTSETAALVFDRTPHSAQVDKGGHFAVREQPELFAAELRAALGTCANFKCI